MHTDDSGIIPQQNGHRAYLIYLRGMPKKQHPLFFIAIVPPSPLREIMVEYKEYFRDNYQSKASLNSPPHITLHMPFKYPEKKVESMLIDLEKVAVESAPFEIELNGFSAFKPRVIYADVSQNNELLDLQKRVVDVCRKKLKLDNANYKDRGFHPHITLAFRDLRKPSFMEAWKEFEHKELKGSFLVNSFVLLKHDGKKWQQFKTLHFEEK